MEHIRKHIAKAFELMGRGGFVSANSSHSKVRRLFESMEEHFEDFYDYFEPLGFRLERGENYFFFSRNEPRQNTENKVERFFEYIDYMHFFANYDSMFGEGARFRLSDLEQKCKQDINFSRMLKEIAPDKDTIRERIVLMVTKMEREGFFEKEDDETESFKVLSSYRFLQSIVSLIDIDPLEEDDTAKVSE